MFDRNSYKEGDYLKLFYLCSKSNPIRVINGEGKVACSYILKNHLEELINPVSIKVDNYAMNLYCGLQKEFRKIDLITDKISVINLKKNFYESSYISCFDFHPKKSFYLSGSYSGKIYLIDKNSDVPWYMISNRHFRGVKSVKFLNTDNNENLFLSAGRSETELLLWDIRNMTEPAKIFYRNNMTFQNLNFMTDNEDKFLFTSNNDGTILIYDILSNEIVSYFYGNEYGTPVNSVGLFMKKEDNNKNYLITSFGTRQFCSENEEEITEDNLILDTNRNNKLSGFRIFEINNLYNF